jgi:hypothetical protein
VSVRNYNINITAIVTLGLMHKDAFYFWNNIDLRVEDADADTIIAYMKSKVFKNIRSDLKRLSPLTTDTCNT